MHWFPAVISLCQSWFTVPKPHNAKHFPCFKLSAQCNQTKTATMHLHTGQICGLLFLLIRSSHIHSHLRRHWNLQDKLGEKNNKPPKTKPKPNKNFTRITLPGHLPWLDGMFSHLFSIMLFILSALSQLPVTVNIYYINVQLLTQLIDLHFKAKQSTEILNCCQ